MHKQLIESTLGTTLRYGSVLQLDTLTDDVHQAGLIQHQYPASSYDVHRIYESVRYTRTLVVLHIIESISVDGPFAMTSRSAGELTILLLVKFFAVMLVVPVFFVPGVVIAIAGLICGQIYIKAQLSVKREMSNARAPVLGQ